MKYKKWCVYVHISPSNKYYVGITSKKPKDRWRNGNGYDYNSYFTRAINKYGWDNFQHEVVANNLTEDEAKNFEKLLIAKLKSNSREFGYNLTCGGDGAPGVQRFGESNSFYGKHHTDKTKSLISDANGYIVCQFDTDMNFICEYISAKEASRRTGIWESMILGCCHNQAGYITAGGYVWIFKDDLSHINFEEYKKRLKHEKIPKPVCQYSLSMEFVAEYESIGKASRATGIAGANISAAISGKYKQAGGYVWILKEELENMPLEEIRLKKMYKKHCCKPVYQFSLDMDFIREFESKTEAGNSVGITPQAISYACHSKTHKSCGYLWWLKDDYEREVVI